MSKSEVDPKSIKFLQWGEGCNQVPVKGLEGHYSVLIRGADDFTIEVQLTRDGKLRINSSLDGMSIEPLANNSIVLSKR